MITISLLAALGIFVFYYNKQINSFENQTCIYRISVGKRYTLENNFEANVEKENIQNLENIDVTQLNSGKNIGQYKGVLTDPRAILEVLVKTMKIQTLLQDSSDLCITEESTVGDTYIAKIVAQHTYYTSEKRTEEYKFSFEYNSKTKDIIVNALQ